MPTPTEFPRSVSFLSFTINFHYFHILRKWEIFINYVSISFMSYTYFIYIFYNSDTNIDINTSIFSTEYNNSGNTNIFIKIKQFHRPIYSTSHIIYHYDTTIYIIIKNSSILLFTFNNILSMTTTCLKENSNFRNP